MKLIMKTLGSTWNALLVGILFGITTVLFIELPISRTNDSTLGESIFGRSEHHQERNVK